MNAVTSLLSLGNWFSWKEWQLSCVTTFIYNPQAHDSIL